MLRSRPKFPGRYAGCPRSAPGRLTAATGWCTHRVALAVTPNGLRSPPWFASVRALTETEPELDGTRLRETWVTAFGRGQHGLTPWITLDLPCVHALRGPGLAIELKIRPVHYWRSRRRSASEKENDGMTRGR